MRKTLQTFVLLVGLSFYLLSAIGVPVFMHYCGGELEEVSAYTKANSCCGDSDEESDCCHNELKVSKLDSQSSLKLTARLLGAGTYQCIVPPVIQSPTILQADYLNVLDRKFEQFSPPLLQQHVVDCSVLKI